MAFMKRTGGRNKLAAVMVIAAGLMVSGGGYAVATTVAQPATSAAYTQAQVEEGEKLFLANCASCHGKQGEGVPGAYPRLAGNRAVTMPVTANLVQVVIHGGFAPATQGHPRPFGMPPFALVLSDADVAAVLTYIRGSWGNRAGTVSELDVAQQRSLR